MIVGVTTWQLTLPGSTSLKDKRSVIKSIKERIRNRFNVSVAETGFQDLRDRGEISVAALAANTALVEALLDQVDRFLESDGRAVIIGTDRSIFV